MAPAPTNRIFVLIPTLLLERGHHLMGEDLQALSFQLGGNEPAGVQLGHDTAQAQLFAELREAIDQAGGAAECDLLAEDLLVRESGHTVGLGLASLGGSSAGAADPRPSELGLASEIVRDALAWLLQGRLVRRPGVDRDAQIDGGLAGMTRLPPRLSVRLHLLPQLGDVRDTQPDEDRQPEPTDHRKGLLGGGGHPDGRMRVLVRTGRDRRVFDPKELARVAEGFPFPGLPDDLEGFAKACLALSVRNSEHLVGARRPAATDPELEPTVADLIHGRNLFGDAQGMVQRKDLNRRAHPQAPGPGGDGAGDEERRGDHRARRIEVDLPEPYTVDSPRVGRVHQLERFLKGRGLAEPVAHLLDEDPEVHRPGQLRVIREIPGRRPRKLPATPPSTTRSWPLT